MELAIFFMNGAITFGMIHYAYTQLFAPIVKNAWLIISYAALLIVTLLLFFEFGNPLIAVSVNVTTILAISLLYSGSLSIKIVTMLFFFALLLMAEGLAYFWLNSIYYIEHGEPMPLNEVLAVARTFHNVIYAPLLFIGTQMLQKVLKKKEISGNFKVPTIYTVVYFIMLVGIVFCSIIIALVFSQELPGRPVPLLVSYLASSIVAFFLIWLYGATLKNLESLEKAKLQEQMLERWDIKYQAASNSHKTIKTLKHNLSIHFLTLSSFLNTDKLEEAKAYLADIIGTLDSVITTENISIDTALNYYQQRSREILGIDLSLELLLPPSLNLDPNIANMILGNAFENAIDACIHVEAEKRYIRVIMKITKQNELYIEIVNPYTVEPVADKVGNLKTTKLDKSNHGLGLISIKEILSEDIGHIYFDYSDNIFRFMAIFYDVRQEGKLNINDEAALVVGI